MTRVRVKFEVSTRIRVRVKVRAGVKVSQGLTSEKKSERMTRLIQWMMLAN